MILPEPTANIRVIAGANSLDIILKNTQYPDDLLAPDAPVACRIEWTAEGPVLVFGFRLPSYDFSEPLNNREQGSARPGWLHQPQITVRLLLADNVIADRVTERIFVLSQQDSDRIRGNQ
ncbi:MAG: hypothetical protein ACO1N1_13510 [Dyadobacter fermentans]